ncbi:MAG: putative Ig domain-containing protein [Kiritimatiellae bacterium]|nr:putative Ig domain-containing protein [Kiritimatiellia bacterium]
MGYVCNMIVVYVCLFAMTLRAGETIRLDNTLTADAERTVTDAITNEVGTVDGYADLAYLDVNGGQYVATGYRPSCTDRVEMRFRFLSDGFSANQFLWCDRTVSGGKDRFSFGKIDGKFRFDRFNENFTAAESSVPIPGADIDYTVTVDYATGDISVNGQRAGGVMSNHATQYIPPTNIMLFASFELGNHMERINLNNHARIRFYAFRVYDRAGTLKCHVVPALDRKNKVLGVYDRVVGVFYKVKGLSRQLGILTPPESESPRINGAKILGVRPGNPILWRIPVTGERPMRFSAKGLPKGATFDKSRGMVGGSVPERGTYLFTVSAENAKGRTRQQMKLVVGDKIALTPPMGWNSWNCFNFRVTEKNIRDAADAMVASGLADHGWTYVNIDDFWQNNPYRFKDDMTLQGAERKPDGTINPNARFPDMKGLAEYIHAKGLKAGLYSSPGPYTCGMCTGSWGHEWQDAKTWADWGYDYLKYDHCTYDKKNFRNGMYSHQGVGTGLEGATLPYRLMGEALKAQKRDIIFSFNPRGSAVTWGENVGGNCWRTGGDFRDSWPQTVSIVEKQSAFWPYARPGAWNDPDMLIVGPISIGGVGTVGMTEAHPCTLTHNEQYTHISMWSILCSPLLIGCDLTKLDDFTRSLLTNDEVIEVNQDELGAQAALVAKGPRAQVWAKPMHDGSLVFALFNTHEDSTRIMIDYDSLGLEGKWLVRDIWRQKDEGIYGIRYSAEVPGHATHLVRLFPKEAARLADGVTDIRMNSVYIQFEESRPIDKPGYKAPKYYPCERCGDE